MIISQTPLRISLLGGGTDLPEWFMKEDGRVVGGTIDKYVYVILSKRFDDKIVVGYSQQEEVDKVEDIKHDLVREAAKFAGMSTGWEVKTMSDIPSGGSGLGSSSAILVGLLKAFYEYKGESITNSSIAKQAYMIERDILKSPVGKQDHFYTALGGKRCIDFVRESVYSSRVTFPDKNLYMFYTGITRNSSVILQEQANSINVSNRQSYERLAHMADVLTTVGPKEKEVLLPKYLSISWEIKKQLANSITNEKIEEMCRLALKGGAEAFKILGAGGGGFLLTYCTVDQIERLRSFLEDYREVPFKFVDHGTRIIFNND